MIFFQKVTNLPTLFWRLPLPLLKTVPTEKAETDENFVEFAKQDLKWVNFVIDFTGNVLNSETENYFFVFWTANFEPRYIIFRQNFVIFGCLIRVNFWRNDFAQHVGWINLFLKSQKHKFCHPKTWKSAFTALSALVIKASYLNVQCALF